MNNASIAGLPPVFINKRKYEPESREMTGAAIKALAGIGNDHELWRLNGENDRSEGTPIDDQQIVVIDRALHFRAVPRDRNYGLA